jgi:hypothetical protein
MNLRTTKNPVFCPMGLRRAMQSALAIVATLALVSSAQAQTYTWTGAGSDNNWFTNATTFTSDNFSSSPLVSSKTTTDLVFSGNTRPNSFFNVASSPGSFDARSLTFNTSVDFTVTGSSSVRGLKLGLGGIDNQVALKQTFGNNARVEISNTGTAPINVVSGGEISFAQGSRLVSSGGSGVAVEKTGAGTLTLDRATVTVNNFIISSGTVDQLGGPSLYPIATSFDLRGGVYNQGLNAAAYYNFIAAPAPDSYFRQSGGVSNFGGIGLEVFAIEISGGTVNVTNGEIYFGGKTTISGGTIAYNGPALGGVNFDSTSWASPAPNGTTTPIVTITGGVQDFGAGTFGNTGGTVGVSVLVTGGTSTGFWSTAGLTNNGGSITFTGNDSNDVATNGVADLNLTSGTVSIGTVPGGGTAIGALLNVNNTYLGVGNTLKLDLDEDLTRDLLITGGTMNWGGFLDLNLTNLGALSDSSSWDFFNDGNWGTTGAFVGHLDGITLTNSTAGSIYDGLTFSRSGDIWTSTPASTGQQFTFNETSGVLVVVPEPSSIAVVGMGLAMLGWRRLARRQRAAA